MCCLLSQTDVCEPSELCTKPGLVSWPDAINQALVVLGLVLSGCVLPL